MGTMETKQRLDHGRMRRMAKSFYSQSVQDPFTPAVMGMTIGKLGEIVAHALPSEFVHNTCASGLEMLRDVAIKVLRRYHSIANKRCYVSGCKGHNLTGVVCPICRTQQWVLQNEDGSFVILPPA